MSEQRNAGAALPGVGISESDGAGEATGLLRPTADRPHDHHCACGAHGTRSPDFGKSWYCFEHDPKRGDERLPGPVKRDGVSWDPCKSCGGKGCPWCQPEQFGLPARKKQPTAPALLIAPANKENEPELCHVRGEGERHA